MEVCWACRTVQECLSPLPLHNFICAKCQSTPLLLTFSVSPCKHTCSLASEMALWRACGSVSLQQLKFMPQWKPSLYGLYRTMNVSSKPCQLPSITRKTIWQWVWVRAHILTRPLKNPFHPAQNNVRQNFIWSFDYKEDDQPNGVRNESELKLNLKII